MVSSRKSSRGLRWVAARGLVAALYVTSLLGAEEPSTDRVERSRRPNIVVLIADDLGYGELGCYGGTEIPTPAIDKLAAGGVRFTQGYVTAPNCSPSRAGLFTGRVPTRFGYEFNPVGAKNEEPQVGLPVGERTIANLLHDAGYTTGLIGKWHLGGTAPFHPQRRGFDEFFGFLHEGHFYVPPPWNDVTTMLRRRRLPDGSTGRWMSERLIYSTHLPHDEPPYDANNPIVRGSQPVTEAEHLTDAFAREAVSFIRRHRDKPFFLVVSFNAVHSPLQGADRYLDQFRGIADVQRRIFAAMLAHLDHGVGQILDELQSTEQDDRTLVVFMSDNGGPTRELTSSNLPLRGGKGDMYEGGVRVPFLVRWPSHLPSGAISNAVTSSLDLLPTFCAAAGADIPAGLDGVDLLPLVLANRVKERQLYWRQGNRTALRAGDWKLVRNRPMSDWELYRLSDDLGESRDLAGEFPDKLRELRAAWDAWNVQMVEANFR